jgi:multidrug efflux pump subunit AcrA (membrane-fusion protein)
MDALPVAALAVSALGLVISGGAATFARQQARSGREQAKAASDQAKAASDQVVAAQQQVVAAQQQVSAANQQIEVARQQLAAAERAQREATEPYVVVDIRARVPGSQLLWFVVENIGPTLAKDVRIAVTPPLATSRGDEAAAKLNAAASRVIPVIPPGRMFGYSMDVGSGFFADPQLPRVYTVTVDATGPRGPVETMTYVIDLNVLADSALNADSIEWSTKRIADELKKIREFQAKNHH